MTYKDTVLDQEQGFDFISIDKTPAKVRDIREKSSSVEDESRIFDEKVMLYRKCVSIDDVALNKNDDYPMSGINEIMRLHMTTQLNTIIFASL